MGSSLSQSPRRGSNSFQKIVDGFLKQPGLPFSAVLMPRLIEEVFRKREALFGIGAIYCTATVLWAFLGQVLRDGKMAACQAAVAQIIAHRKLLGLSVPTEYTGDYCRARAKLDEQALRELTQAVGENAEAESDSKWLFNGRHAKLVDGFTFTMPDPP
jgi:putative transposase